MSRLKLTIATTDYDHFRDFRLGLVNAEGIDHIWLTLGHHEVFARFTFNREWDVSELSFAKFCAQVTREQPDFIGLPVVCSRLFRFSSFYVNKKSGIKTAADLKGKTIGSPEWAHTAAVYMRAAARPRRVALSARLAADLCAQDARPVRRRSVPYGIEENRPTLEQFLRYTHEQGIAHRHVAPEDIFPKGIMTSVRV
jgi:hypothetical protein